MEGVSLRKYLLCVRPAIRPDGELIAAVGIAQSELRPCEGIHPVIADQGRIGRRLLNCDRSSRRPFHGQGDRRILRPIAEADILLVLDFQRHGVEVQRIVAGDSVLACEACCVVHRCHEMKTLSSCNLSASGAHGSRCLIDQADSIFKIDGDDKCLIRVPCERRRCFSRRHSGGSRADRRIGRVRHLLQSCLALLQQFLALGGKHPAVTGGSVIKVIHQIMLHLAGIASDPVFVEDCLDAVAVEGSLPAGPAVAIEHGFAEILVVSSLIQLVHVRISGSAGRRMKIMLHAVGHNVISDAIHLIADPLVGIRTAVTKVVVEDMAGIVSVGMVVVLSSFYIGLVVPADVAVIIRGSCLSRSHQPAWRRTFDHVSRDRKLHIFRRHDEAVGIILRIISDLTVVSGIIVIMIDRAPGCDIGRGRVNIRPDHNLLSSFVIAILVVQGYVVLGPLFHNDLISSAFSLGIRFCLGLGLLERCKFLLRLIRKADFGFCLSGELSSHLKIRFGSCFCLQNHLCLCRWSRVCI